jgi:hypothetical protein
VAAHAAIPLPAERRTPRDEDTRGFRLQPPASALEAKSLLSEFG